DGEAGGGVVGAAVEVDDVGAGFASDDRSGGHVPGLVAQGDRRGEGGVGGPGEVDGGGSEHSDALGAWSERGVDGQRGGVACAGGGWSGGVVADGHDRCGQCGGVGGGDRVAVAEGAEPGGGPVGVVELGQGDDAEHGFVGVDQGEGD